MLMKLFLAIFTGVFAWSPIAQAPSSVKLYVFDCGTLKSGNPDVLLARGVTTTDMSVTAYLIVHPRGTLLWDNFTPFAALGNPENEVASKAKIEALLKEKKATLWIQHDILAFARLKKSPANYE